jgi:hypothetical protein
MPFDYMLLVPKHFGTLGNQRFPWTRDDHGRSPSARTDRKSLVSLDLMAGETTRRRPLMEPGSLGQEECIDNKKRPFPYNIYKDEQHGARDAIYGLDIPLMHLGNVFKSAAEGYGAERRVILLHGPVGTSKSTIARLSKHGIEEYSRTPEMALYTFEWNLPAGLASIVAGQSTFCCSMPGDSRDFNLDSEFNNANRGVIEFIEVLKLGVAFLYDLLGASQEHKIKRKRFAKTDIDEVSLGHTSDAGYRKRLSTEFVETRRHGTPKVTVSHPLREGPPLGLADETRDGTHRVHVWSTRMLGRMTR